MSPPSANLHDSNRLRVLQYAKLLDQPPEEAFDRLTRIATRLLNVPIALVSFVDNDRQFFKSQVGLPPALAIPRQTPLSHSFCKYVVLSAEPLIVRDSREHPILKNNPVILHDVVAYAGIPLIMSDGLVLGSFCAIDSQPRDWTEQQIDDLRELAATVVTEIELRLANESKDRFIAMLSHELRTPLSPALLTAIEMGADPALPERFRESVRVIHRNIELEARMIDALLDVTRINSGKLHLNQQEVDLHALLHAAVASAGADARLKSINFSFELQAQRYFINGDAPKLQQVFGNLLSNAIKFSLANGRITLRTGDAPDGGLQIEVIDSGMGISPQVLPRIFDSFEQGGSQTTKAFGGLGLGLAICNGIVDAHDGQIIASSAGMGLGTVMTVLLPNAFAPIAKVPDLKPADPQNGRNVSILLVEDHEDTLRAMSRLLRKSKHQVVTANSMSTAMEAAGNQPFDLLISDLGLPDGTGIELMKQLAAKYPIKGIALTGYGMESDIEHTKTAGFERHLTKPINFADLLTAINELAGTC
jgi:signal transduction histidine kinase/CheY-like chemotaxis protein